MTIPPSKTNPCSTASEAYAARTLLKDEVTESYCKTLVYNDLSRRERTRRVYWNGVLKLIAARLYKCALQVQIQGKRFERIAEPLENKKAIFVVPAHC